MKTALKRSKEIEAAETFEVTMVVEYTKTRKVRAFSARQAIDLARSRQKRTNGIRLASTTNRKYDYSIGDIHVMGVERVER
tara:strand:+ start:98 stop:340 length:243 start_codon:yes stop_codon:yes gene_type:complete